MFFHVPSSRQTFFVCPLNPDLGRLGLPWTQYFCLGKTDIKLMSEPGKLRRKQAITV